MARGPRRTVQSGVVYAASRTGLPIVPVGVGFGNAWRAKSWDHFGVPKPLSTVYGVLGAPIAVPPDIERDDLEVYRVQVEQAMLAATAEAEEWAEACLPLPSGERAGVRGLHESPPRPQPLSPKGRGE